ncbi:MAG: S1C family serine protease [Mycetocola sp.]
MTTTPQQPEGTEPEAQNTPAEASTEQNIPAREAESTGAAAGSPQPTQSYPASDAQTDRITDVAAATEQPAAVEQTTNTASPASPAAAEPVAPVAPVPPVVPAQAHAHQAQHAAAAPAAAGESFGAQGAPYSTPAGAASDSVYSAATPSPYQSGQPRATATKRTGGRAGLLLAGLAIGALVGGGAGAGVSALVANTSSSSSGSSSTVQTQNLTVNDSDNVTRATAIAAVASPSVVTLSVQGGSANGSSGSGSGSGVVLSEDGYVLTNNHVVTLDGQLSDPTIRVTASDGKIYNASIVGTDPVYDLAVVKLEGATGLKPMEFADSDKLNVGDTAVAIGAPLGLAGTVTDGIVSALNRSITVASSAVPDSADAQDSDSGSGTEGSPFEGWGFNLPGQEQQTQSASTTISLAVVQTDAAINPGNSGGALVNSDGQLIGVNVAIASAGSSSSDSSSGSIGVGFAIQSNVAKRIADEIIASGSATHALLGATVDNAANLATSTTVGAVLGDLTSGGAAEKAGLKSGDIITSFNGHPISNATDLTAQVRALAAGATAEISYVRNGEEHTAEATLGTLNL